MYAKLITESGQIFEREIVLDNLPVVIGRGPAASIRLEDRWASRLNCEIDQDDGELVVRDLGSSNGTLLNGSHVTESPLKHGDKLTIGMTTFVVTYQHQNLENLDGSESTDDDDSTLLLRNQPPVECGLSKAKPR